MQFPFMSIQAVNNGKVLIGLFATGMSRSRHFKDYTHNLTNWCFWKGWDLPWDQAKLKNVRNTKIPS
jgi:hypothetical protein